MSNEERVRGLFAAVLAGDEARIKTFIAPDMVLRVPQAMPYARIYHGPNGFMELLSNFSATWKLDRMEHTELFARADGACFVLRFELAGIVVSTGQPFATSVLESWEFKNGLLTEVLPHWFDIPSTAAEKN